MDLDVRWRPGPQVISETLEGETVIINLDTGRYYSLDRLASWLWTAIADGGATGGEAAEAMARAWQRERRDVEGAVTSFLATAATEGLVVDGGGPAPGTPLAFDPALPFTPPQVSRFDDIQELLLLDPIHEVDEAGWPVPRSAAPDEGS